MPRPHFYFPSFHFTTVKNPGRTVCPAELITVTAHLPYGIAGTVQVIEVSLHFVIFAWTLPNFTFLSVPLAAPKFVPVITTMEPRFPEEGTTPVMSGRTVNLIVSLLVQVSVTTMIAPEKAVSGTIQQICLSDQEMIRSQSTAPILTVLVP